VALGDLASFSFVGLRRRGGLIIISQKLASMAERDAFGLHHPGDHIAALAAGPETIPEILIRTHHQGRLFIIMERAQAPIVLAGFQKYDPRRLHKTHKRSACFKPINLLIRDARQLSGLFLKPVNILYYVLFGLTFATMSRIVNIQEVGSPCCH
jgi:hypothetical protein